MSSTRNPPTRIYTNCKPSKVFDLNQYLSPTQRDAVCEIGLGGLLTTPEWSVNHELCHWILQRFDPEVNPLDGSYNLHVFGKDIKVTPKDVFDILGLKNYGHHVPVRRPNNYARDVDNEIVRKSQNQLYRELISGRSSDNMFKQKYALFVLAKMLIPTADAVGIRETLFYIVQDMYMFMRMNLAKYVLEFLASGIRRYHMNRLLTLKGCVFFIEVFV